MCGPASREGTPITNEWLTSIIEEEVAEINRAGAEPSALQEARQVFEEVVFADTFIPFLTIPAYRYLA